MKDRAREELIFNRKIDPRTQRLCGELNRILEHHEKRSYGTCFYCRNLAETLLDYFSNGEANVARCK